MISRSADTLLLLVHNIFYIKAVFLAVISVCTQRKYFHSIVLIFNVFCFKGYQIVYKWALLFVGVKHFLWSKTFFRVKHFWGVRHFLGAKHFLGSKTFF